MKPYTSSENITGEVAPRLKTILVVDENPRLCGLIACELGALGYRVLTAYDAREARATIEETGPIDLLMTELKLAGMRSGELADWFREENPEAKILLMCRETEEMKAERDLESVHKPFEMEDIGERVMGLLGCEAGELVA
jgi:DNA-binding response OmpR family regulator